MPVDRRAEKELGTACVLVSRKRVGYSMCTREQKKSWVQHVYSGTGRGCRTGDYDCDKGLQGYGRRKRMWGKDGVIPE